MTSLTTSPTTATAALGVAPTTQLQNQVVYPGYPGMQPSTRRGIGRTWLTKAAACRVRLACDIIFVPRTSCMFVSLLTVCFVHLQDCVPLLQHFPDQVRRVGVGYQRRASLGKLCLLAFG